MSPAPGAPTKVLTQPRPGHADLAGMQKYGFADARDVLERASARETAARVAVGALAKALLAELGVSILSHVVQLGDARVPDGIRPSPGDLATVDASSVRCFDPASEEGLDLGVLTVAEGAVAYLAHPEHAYSGIGAGTYVLRRQRELDTSRPGPEELAERAAAVAEKRESARVRYVRD